MWNIKQILKKTAGNQLDKLLKFNLYQNYVNDRYNKQGYMNINEQYLENCFYSYNGFEYHINDQIDSIHDVFKHYDASDIKSTDIVLDIGGNVGAFTMLAARKCKQVYTVEPLFGDIIRNNLRRNNITNVKVLDFGLGNKPTTIRYGKFNKLVECKSLSEIIFLCGSHIDFLKCDCEGGEWSIKPHELSGIRRIEAEIHNLDGFHDVKGFNKMLERNSFICKYEDLDEVIEIIHAVRVENAHTNKCEYFNECPFYIKESIGCDIDAGPACGKWRDFEYSTTDM